MGGCWYSQGAFDSRCEHIGFYLLAKRVIPLKAVDKGKGNIKGAWKGGGRESSSRRRQELPLPMSLLGMRRRFCINAPCVPLMALVKNCFPLAMLLLPGRRMKDKSKCILLWLGYRRDEKSTLVTGFRGEEQSRIMVNIRSLGKKKTSIRSVSTWTSN